MYDDNFLSRLIYKIKYFIDEDKIRAVAIVVCACIPFVLFSVFNKPYVKALEQNRLNRMVRLHPRNKFDGNSFITDTYPIFKDVVLVGDSYSLLLGTDLGANLLNYSVAGYTVKELSGTFRAAIDNPKKYFVIFIGPNDFNFQTDPKEFSDTIKGYIDTIRNNLDSTVILSEYLPSTFTKLAEESKDYDYKYTIEMYNDEIKKLADEDNKIFYFDLTDLNDYDKYRRDNESDDYIHLNKQFNIAYINKLYDFLLKIKQKEIDDIK